MNKTHLKICDLSFSYLEKNKENKIFEHLNIAFEIGKKTAIMAPSGTGKTTLLYLLAGLLSPDAGTIEYPVSPKVSMVFQENRLLEQESILCNLRFANEKITSEYASHMLKSASLNYSPDQKVSSLSGGEKRRVAILRALMCEYNLLLLDEPFTGLDNVTKQVLMELILKETVQKTVILVTHDKSEADFLNCQLISNLFMGA